MADQWYVDLEAVQGLLQILAGQRVQVVMDGDPEKINGFADITDMGAPLMTADPDDVLGRPALTLRATVGAWVGRGDDDITRSYDSGTDRLKVTLFGQRDFTMTIKAEGDGVTTHAAVERLRTLFRMPSTIQAFRDLGLVIRSVGPTQAMTLSWDNRQVDASIMEVFLSFGVEMLDPVGESDGAYIKKVTATGTMVEGNHTTTIGPTLYDPEE